MLQDIIHLDMRLLTLWEEGMIAKMMRNQRPSILIMAMNTAMLHDHGGQL
nr:hypothetical protein [Maribacter aestuarii]